MISFYSTFSLPPQPKQKSEIGLIGQGLKAFGKTCAFRLFKVKNMKICPTFLKRITAKSLEIRLQPLPIFHRIYIHELDKSTI